MYTKIDKPTEAGWYWFEDMHGKAILEVHVVGGELRVFESDGHCYLMTSSIEGHQWYGPKIEEPRELESRFGGIAEADVLAERGNKAIVDMVAARMERTFSKELYGDVEQSE